MKYSIVTAIFASLLLSSCSGKLDYDASGNFEADEVIVSAQQNGEILSFTVSEGDRLKEGDSVGQVDVTIPQLQKEQAEASISSLKDKTSSPDEQVKLVKRQLAVQQAQLEQQYRERARTQNLVKADAATQKQLDDINAAIDQLQKQIKATQQQVNLYESNTATQNRGILSEQKPLAVTAKQYQEQVRRGTIVNPLAGIVLTKYALKGEMAAIGKPLYKIANTDTLTLKAYVTADKLVHVKTGDAVTVRIDQGKKEYKKYTGTITWISDKSEFTPKTIQTKDERANLVYATKIKVKNDGYLRIGMYGEAIFKQQK